MNTLKPDIISLLGFLVYLMIKYIKYMGEANVMSSENKRNQLHKVILRRWHFGKHTRISRK